MRRLAGAERRDIRFASTHETRGVPLLANSIPYERGVPCYRRAHASNPPGLGGRRGRAAWQPHANPRGEASVAIQECLGGHCQSPSTSPGEAAVAPGEAPSAEWDDCMLLGLILFWIVGNLLFCFLSWRFGRGSGRQLAEELRRTRSKPTLAPDGPDLSPGSTALIVTRLPSH